MSKIYPLRLVYDYIWGNDIKGYGIDDLENDPNFMIEVLERSHDKNMYQLCSDTVKCNYTFVRRVIDLFSNDLDFLSVVAEYYLESLTEAEKEHGISYTELNIIMSNLYGRTLNDFAIRAAGFYMTERLRQEACVSVLDGEARVDSKQGFVFTSVQYEDSNIIVDYVAKRMVNEVLFGERYSNLEYLIHKRFRSIDEFHAYGAVNFLHDCVGEFDACLRDYTFHERSERFNMFFGSAIKDIDRVVLGWPAYMDRVNSWRINMFEYDMTQFMLENRYAGNLDYNHIVSYVAHKLGFAEVFKKFDSEFIEVFDENKYRVLDVSDVLCINKGMELAERLFSVDVIDDEYVDSGDVNAKALVNSEEPKTGVVKFQMIEHGIARK